MGYRLNDLTKYEYIITTPYEITSTNIKYANNPNCTYIDTSTVKCLIPFEYLKKSIIDSAGA